MNFVKKNINRFGLDYILLILATLLSKSLGLLRESIVAYNFGTSSIFDVYLVILVVPTLISSLFLYTVPHVIIPRLKGINKTRKDIFKEFNDSFFWLFSILNLIITILYLFSTRHICLYFFYNTPLPYCFDNLLMMLRLFSLYIFFMIEFSLLRAFYLSIKKFIFPAYIQLLTHLVVILFVTTLSQKINVYSLIYGLIFGTLLQILFMFFDLNNRKYLKYLKYRINKQSGLKTSILFIIGIEMLGQTYSFIDRSFFSDLPKGYITSLHYAEIISNLPIAIFGISLGNIVFPSISQLYISKQFRKLKKYLLTNILKLMTIGIPISLIFFFEGNYIVEILLQRGKFDIDATILTSNMLKYLSIGIPFALIHTIFAKLMFSMKKEFIFFLITIFGVILKYFFNLYFIKNSFNLGIAFSNSIVFIFYFFTIGIYILKKLYEK